MFFWNSLSVFKWSNGYRQFDLVPLPFLNPAWTSGRSQFMYYLLKTGLENVEHYFALSMWDECNCAVLWAVFVIAFLYDWNENWPFPSCGYCWFFSNLLTYCVQHFTASSFRIWKSSTGIPSPLLDLFIMMLPKAHLALHSRMSGSRWVSIPLWLSGLWRSFLYSAFLYSHHLFLISSASVKSTSFLSLLCPSLHEMFP